MSGNPLLDIRGSDADQRQNNDAYQLQYRVFEIS